MSEIGQPLVSIIIPSYNQGKFLQETLDSIFEQDYRPLEVVVVDGASKDESVSILERSAAEHPELRWVSEPDDGPEHAINKGLEMIKGEIAAIQSSDDFYLPGAVRAAVEGFARHPEAGIVYGDAKQVDGNGTLVWGPTNCPAWTLERFLCTSTIVAQSSTFFRPDLARQVGGIRKRYFVFDTDLWLRMMFIKPAVKIPGVLSAYRHHDEQRDTQVDVILSSFRQMMAESPEIRAAGWRVRLAAWAGGQMLTQSYNPTQNPRYSTLHMWLAILAYPPSIRAVSKPELLIPTRPTGRGLRRRLAGTRPAG